MGPLGGSFQRFARGVCNAPKKGPCARERNTAGVRSRPTKTPQAWYTGPNLGWRRRETAGLLVSVPDCSANYLLGLSDNPKRNP